MQDLRKSKKESLSKFCNCIALHALKIKFPKIDSLFHLVSLHILYLCKLIQAKLTTVSHVELVNSYTILLNFIFFYSLIDP